MQSTMYPKQRGLIRGTLFKDLEFPFLGATNRADNTTPLSHIQALQFAVQEIAMYLDTHPWDTDALEIWQQYVALYNTMMEQYQENNPPLHQDYMTQIPTYHWSEGPWPWQFRQEDDICLSMKKNYSTL